MQAWWIFIVAVYFSLDPSNTPSTISLNSKPLTLQSQMHIFAAAIAGKKELWSYECKPPSKAGRTFKVPGRGPAPFLLSPGLKNILLLLFLAVQDSSIGDLVTPWVGESVSTEQSYYGAFACVMKNAIYCPFAFFIQPGSYQILLLSATDQINDCYLWNLNDVTLAEEDTFSDLIAYILNLILTLM